MSALPTDVLNGDYKIKDLSLAEWGRKEIRLAESEMPALMRLREKYQAEQLDKLGMEVIPVELRDAYAFGGGLHCCTADVYREGDLKDYFPKQ